MKAGSTVVRWSDTEDKVLASLRDAGKTWKEISVAITELGYGVVLEDVLVPPLVAVATALVSLLAMIQRAPRAIDSSSQE